jgi:hypothetical protein
MEKEKQAANGLEFLSENSCFTYGDNTDYGVDK